MKITIDTTNKINKAEEKINVGDLFTTLFRLYPNNEWKEYYLDLTINNIYPNTEGNSYVLQWTQKDYDDKFYCTTITTPNN